jgi:hydrogenase-1 operon protein HyaF
MTDISNFADDVLVDALIIEVASLLRRLIDHGEAGSIDLNGLPLQPSCVADLEQRLGYGEVTVRLDAAGISEIHETKFSGVWWARHHDEVGRVVATLIEVTFVPDIIRADKADLSRAYPHLLAATHVAEHARRICP